MGWRFMFALPMMAIASWWVCTGLIGTKKVATVKLEEDCARYISKALPKIINGWRYEEWRKRASTELKDSLDLKRVKSNFKMFDKAFGELIEIKKPVGKVMVDNSGGVPETIGFYTNTVRFEMGNADISMRLIKRAGGWKFQQFSVRSDLVPSNN